jgi:hypothetical protein
VPGDAHGGPGNRTCTASVILSVIRATRPALCALAALALTLVAGCSSGGGKHAGPTTPSTTIPARSSATNRGACRSTGAAVVLLDGKHQVGNPTPANKTVAAGQRVWVSTQAGLTRPETRSGILRVICRAETDTLVGALFQAIRPGVTQVVTETKCARGCNELAFVADITVVSATRLVKSVGRCPSTPFFGSAVGGFNRGIRGIGERMVPITALNVRLCEYGLDGRLTRVTLLKAAAALRLQAHTNLLRTLVGDGSSICHPAQLSFLLIFADDAQQVDVRDFCGVVVNGAVAAKPTKNWLNELQP